MERSLKGFGAIVRRLFVIVFAIAMVAAAFVVLPSEVKADLPMRIAYFRDWDPWGTLSNENAMGAVGISYDTYTSADFGSVVLSNYKKLVIGSAQPNSFYQAIANDRPRLESWLLTGGVFEMHMAAYTSEDWSGIYMPGGFTSEMDLVDGVAIVDPGHDIVTIPNAITDDELDNWFYSSHGLVRDISSPYDVLLSDEASGDPVGVEIFFGKGTVLATMQTLEWAYNGGRSPILENFIAYMPTRHDHDIAVVGLDVPDVNERTQTVTVNATIKNFGLNEETGFIVNFLVNGIPAGDVIVPSLASRNGTVVSFPWTPMVDGSYNITIRVPPIPLENVTTNNERSEIVTVIDTTPPETPTGLSVDLVPSGNSLNISWDANTEPDLTFYNLYRSMDAITYVLADQIPAGTEYYVDTGLGNGLTYFYRASAEDYVPNESPWSHAIANAPDFDSDGDGVGDMSDFDDDNDGVPDIIDRFPLDPTESSDADGDGIGDNADPDDDNDGVNDPEDEFPRNPDEWVDTDGDGVGDNADNDDDDDGYTDDLENQLGSDPKDPNSIPLDTDGDGVPDVYDDDDDNDGYSDVVEEEAGSDPKDPNSIPVDTDGDGIIDQYDEDDDDDGYSDLIEEEAGSDPKNAQSTPPDNDGDGIIDQYDEDDDNDGFSDSIEEEAGSDPLSAISQPEDTDGDGIIDLYDPDDDNDGVYDDQDAFPTYSAESVDTDGDRVGNQLDEDDDGDGVPDSLDDFPLNPFEYVDTDNDGIGDNSDIDSDGNGIADYLEPVAPDPPEDPFDYTPILLIVVIVLMIVILVAMMRSGKEQSTKEESSLPPPED
ncbi:MAG: thrombospondin type 3 repeat-containing protein [Thermoplasmata archaeon]|nr:thrombospondin type 3 repeat-containing protein [Thermoplasmata archaeon]